MLAPESRRPLIAIFVTESAFYPPYQGDSRRLHALISNMKVLGWKVHVVHLHDEKQADADYDMMGQLAESLTIYRPTHGDLARRCYTDMDSFCPDGLIECVKSKVSEVRPTALIVQFVFLSKCLAEDFGSSEAPVRIIDADNIFSGRAELYYERGLPYGWFSTDPQQERVGLLRADLIAAIQEEEQRRICQIVPGKLVVLLPHMERTSFQPGVTGHELLFVGALNAENTAGLRSFIQFALPEIARMFPAVSMLVAGRVCDAVIASDHVMLCGVVQNLGELYARAAIVLNLAPVGTGLKIKTVEALCHGKCLVTTRAGAQGLESYRDVYLTAETPEEFSKTIRWLLANPREIVAIGDRAAAFSNRYFDPDAVTRRFHDAIIALSRRRC